MAVSLSPHQLNQVMNLSSFNTTLQSQSTPRQFVTAVHDLANDDKTLNQVQLESPGSDSAHVGHGSEEMNNHASPKLVESDLPSWTPLRSFEDDEDSSSSGSDREVDKDTETFERGPKPTSAAKPSGVKRARFDGIVITTKPPPSKRRSRPRIGPTPASKEFSLVDALARTFDANRYIEEFFPRHPRRTSGQRDDSSTAPQTDAETTTEADDERPGLNARLAYKPLKRPFARTTLVPTRASETNSEDATSVAPDVPPAARPAKRLKPIRYESNSNLVDAALGTVEAPISWNHELDIITRDEEDFADLVQITHANPAGAGMAVDEGNHTPDTSGTRHEPTLTRGRKELHMPTQDAPKRAVMAPYLSRGTRFRERLEAMFGANAIVRTDRVARPRPVEYDFYAPFDEQDRESSPDNTGSIISASSASVAGGVASAIVSTHNMSQSPEGLSGNELSEAGTLIKSTFIVSEEVVGDWIIALQRLIKGKVRISEEDLETLSIILAEIESVKDSLDESGTVTQISELRENVKQLSELDEIPFEDRNKLRQRAKHIFQTWPSMWKQETS